MADNIYSISEIVGSSTESIDDAIRGAVGRASKTLHNLDWFEVTDTRGRIEDDRRLFLGAMAQIKQQMILGVDKNVYVEPAIWTIEWARAFYDYPVTRSN